MSGEQLDECEALRSIYGDDFASSDCAGSSSATAVSFSLKILPNGSSPSEDAPNHVGIVLKVEFPPTYPETVPILTIPAASAKGLETSQLAQLEASAKACAEKNLGAPSIYEVTECIREWLLEHNEPQGSGSAYDEMIKERRAAEKAALASSKSGEYNDAIISRNRACVNACLVFA